MTLDTLHLESCAIYLDNVATPKLTWMDIWTGLELRLTSLRNLAVNWKTGDENKWSDTRYFVFNIDTGYVWRGFSWAGLLPTDQLDYYRTPSREADDWALERFQQTLTLI